jgi:hypothetical protein
MRRSGATVLLTLLLALLPGAARSALDLTSLALTVKTEGTKGVDTVFQVTVTVTGTDIASASIAPAAGGTALPLTCGSPTSCSVTQSLANQAALDALLPTTARNYTLALTGTTGTSPPTVTDTFAFARPVVSSPAISAPVDGSSIDPGPLEVKFVACTATAVAATTPATCAATQGLLLQGTAQLEEKLDLPASSTSWTPATALTEQSAFSVRITHAAGGSQNFTADGIAAEADAYVFTTSVTHSDQVAFSTGFAAPVGEFCIVVNDDPADALDPTGCVLVEEPAAGILDTSDSCTTSAAGIPVQYGFQLAASGALSGIADADVDGDGSFETHADLTGRLKGKEGLLRQKLRVRFDAPSSETRFSLRIREQADLATLQGAIVPPLEWLVEQTTRGKAAGAKLSESTTTLRNQPAQPSDGIQCAGGTARTGWKLSFILTGTDGPTSGTLQLANDDVSVALRAKQSFDSGSNQTDLKLESEAAERGVRIRVKRLAIDVTKQINSGAVRFRAFGQGGSLMLPTTVPVTTTTTTTTSTTTTTTTSTTTTIAP